MQFDNQPTDRFARAIKDALQLEVVKATDEELDKAIKDIDRRIRARIHERMGQIVLNTFAEYRVELQRDEVVISVKSDLHEKT